MAFDEREPNESAQENRCFPVGADAQQFRLDRAVRYAVRLENVCGVASPSSARQRPKRLSVRIGKRTEP